jgi:hypothetical protein
MRKVLSASRKTYRKTMSYVNNYLNTSMNKDFLVKFMCAKKGRVQLSFKIIIGSLPQTWRGRFPFRI